MVQGSCRLPPALRHDAAQVGQVRAAL